MELFLISMVAGHLLAIQGKELYENISDIYDLDGIKLAPDEYTDWNTFSLEGY